MDNQEINQAKVIRKYVILGILGLFALIMLLGMWTIVSAGERGVITHFGKVSDVIFDEGFHFKIPFYDSVHKMNVQTQTVTFDNAKKTGDETEASSLFAASKDLQDVQIATVVNYHLDPLRVNRIYQKYGSTYQVNVINPIIREVVKSVSAQYTAEELVTKRLQFADQVSKLLIDKLGEKDAIFERFNVVNFEFSQEFTKAIEAKVTAVQQAEAAKNKLEQVKFEASQRIEQARGEAEAIKIQAQAIQSQGGAEYIKLKWVEKWNGTLPQTMLGDNSTPLININK